MTFVPQNPETVVEGVAPKQRTQNTEAQELLAEIIVLLKINNAHLQIITNVEFGESDV